MTRFSGQTKGKGRMRVAGRLIRTSSVALISLLICTSGASADEAFGNRKAGVALHSLEFFSRPLTVLEQVLENVSTRAKQLASAEIPTKDYGLEKAYRIANEAGAGYDVNSGRTVLYLELYVNYMADPWREVCLNRLKQYFQYFYFPKASTDDEARLRMMAPYFGHTTETDPVNAARSIGPFLRSIIVRVKFSVLSGDEKKLAWVRSCQLDNDTGKAAFYEHRFQGP